MKKKILAVAAAVVLLAACFFIYRIWNARKAASSAVEAYNAAAQEYNDAISPYNEAAAGIADENTKLQTALDSADAVLKKGGEAYEPDTQKKLEKAVKKARKSLTEAPVLIDPFEIRTVPAVFSTKELALLQDEAETAREMAEDAKGKIPAVPEVPDFSEEINEVGAAQKNYENSIRMLANITKPSDRFVKERLGRIKTVIQAEAVTPENDPNGLLGKKDGYIGCVYFLDESVDQSLLPKEAFSKKEKKEKKDTADEAMSADTAATVSEAKCLRIRLLQCQRQRLRIRQERRQRLRLRIGQERRLRPHLRIRQERRLRPHLRIWQGRRLRQRLRIRQEQRQRRRLRIGQERKQRQRHHLRIRLLQRQKPSLQRERALQML